MFCNRCGQSIEATDAFCRHCGATNPMAGAANPAESANAAGEASQEQAYTRTDYTPGQSSRTTTGQSVQSSGNQPGVTGSIIFSVINIVAFGFGVSMILGIIALVITLNANNQLTGEALATKLRTARTLNIVAIALVLLQIIVIVSTIVFAVLGTVMWGVWG